MTWPDVKKTSGCGSQEQKLIGRSWNPFPAGAPGGFASRLAEVLEVMAKLFRSLTP